MTNSWHITWLTKIGFIIKLLIGPKARHKNTEWYSQNFCEHIQEKYHLLGVHFIPFGLDSNISGQTLSDKGSDADMDIPTQVQSWFRTMNRTPTCVLFEIRTRIRTRYFLELRPWTRTESWLRTWTRASTGHVWDPRTRLSANLWFGQVPIQRTVYFERIPTKTPFPNDFYVSNECFRTTYCRINLE